MEFLGTPLPYQEEDLHFMHSRMQHPGRCILTHKTGLGKTFITLAGAVRRGDRRILVVGTTKSLAVWLTEVPRWTQVTPVLIDRLTPNREALWRDVCQRDDVIVLIGYELFLRLIGSVKGRQQLVRKSMRPWDLLVLDEAHKKMRSHKTQTLKTLECIPNRHISVLSATLASRGPQDMWAALHLVSPTTFSSYWRYVAQHCHVMPGEFGQMIGPIRDPKYTREVLRRFCISRGNEVRTQMLPIRQTVEFEMDPEQAGLYYQFLDELVLQFDDGSVIISRNRLAQVPRLRTLALCPRALNPALPVGAGAEYILEELEEDPHVVVFAPYKAILEVLRTEIEKMSDGPAVFVVQGGMAPAETNEVIAKWKASKGVCLCTIASAESFALDTVNVAYFLGAEYDPTLNIQAEGRLQRIDSADRGITIRYIIIRGTIEEDVKDIINGKVANVSKFMDTYINKVKTERLHAAR